MAERRRAALDYVEPDAAQKARMLQDLDNFFAAHYGAKARKN